MDISICRKNQQKKKNVSNMRIYIDYEKKENYLGRSSYLFQIRRDE